MKISKRISLSFILVLVLFFILSSIFFAIMAKRAYLFEAKKDLKKEVTYLINDETLLTRVLTGEKKRPARDPAELTFLMDSNLIVVSDQGQMIYSENQKEAEALLAAVRKNQKPDDVIFVRHKIERPDFSGSIIIYYRIDEIRQALLINRRAGIWGLLFALPVTLIFAWYIQRRISGPIQELKEQMDEFSERKGMKFAKKDGADEVEVLTRTFTALQEAIEENEINRELLFSNISHELKTPLMTIRGYAEGIQEGVIDSEQGLTTIIEETGRLNAFAQKILTLSKLSTQPLQRECVSLSLLLQGTFQRYEPMVMQAGFELELGTVADAKLMMDEEKYRQAVGNLITNAIRYAHQKITIGSAETQNRLGIYVEDDGAGVPKERLDQIFTRFEKGARGETGLGLAIVKRIMDQHGGEVRAENGQAGFRVTLWFPKELN